MQRWEQPSASMAVEVCGFAVMSNHLHAVVRTRPDLVETWSDEEVARRWWRLFPKRRDEDGNPAEPEDHELAMIVADADALAERRRRLSSLSWFMRLLCEPIARRANKEDGVSGRFFEGRFKCQKLLDEAAILACSVYVDLNPVRAGIRRTPESSPHTSAPILERIGMSDEFWLDTVRNFGRRFHRAAGHVSLLAQEATRAGKRWFQGMSHCRQAFA